MNEREIAKNIVDYYWETTVGSRLRQVKTQQNPVK